MGLSLGHLLILLVVLLIFGRNRLPSLGTALGKGVRSFKAGLAESRRTPEEKDSDSDRDSG